VPQTLFFNFDRHDTFFRYSVDTDDDLQTPLSGCGEKLVFQQDHKIVIVWNMILAVLLVYVGTIFLYRFSFMAFHIDESGSNPLGEHDVAWNVWDYIVDGLFWFDLLFHFFCSYEDADGYEVINMWLIAKRYMRGMFWLNLLACLPEEALSGIMQLIVEQSDNKVKDLGVARVYRLQRVSRLARLARLTRLAKLANFSGKIPFWDDIKSMRGVRVMNFIFGLLFACHLLACGWYLIAALHDDVSVTWVGQRTIVINDEEKSLLAAPSGEQWVVAMYFILTVFTTVGFGDISANTEAEIMFVAVVMLVGAVAHSIIISQVIQIVTSNDRNDEFIEKQLSLFDAFASHVGIDEQTLKTYREDLKDRSRQSVSNPSFVKEDMKTLLLSKYMPRHIVERLPSGLFGGKLSQNALLRCCSEAFPLPPRLPSLLAINLLPAEYMSGEVVFQLHDFAFHINVVLDGTFAYVGHPLSGGGVDAMPPAQEVEKETPVEDKMGGRMSVFLGRHLAPPSRRVTLTPASQSSSTRSAQQLNVLFPYKLFGPKTYFGDYECLKGTMRHATMRCENRGTALLLRKRDFFELVQEFPQFGDVWYAAAVSRESTRRRALSRLRRPHSYRGLAAASIQQAYRAWKRRITSRASEQCGLRVRPSALRSGIAFTSRSSSMGGMLRTAPSQSLSFLKGEVSKMNSRIGTLQVEMQQQSAEITEVQEALHALLQRQRQKASTGVLCY